MLWLEASREESPILVEGSLVDCMSESFGEAKPFGIGFNAPPALPS